MALDSILSLGMVVDMQVSASSLHRRESYCLLGFVSVLVVLCPSVAIARDAFYDYYEQGQVYMRSADWVRAIEEFKSAASLEFEDSKSRRTYGTRYIEYFPHREMGVAYYNLGDCQNARKELDLSMSYTTSERASAYLQKCAQAPQLPEGAPRPDTGSMATQVAALKAEQARLAAERERIAKQQEELGRLEQELLAQKRLLDDERAKLARERPVILPEGALTYDPSRVTQVGSRLSVGVLAFGQTGGPDGWGGQLGRRMVERMVSLKRFKVLEQAEVDELLRKAGFKSAASLDERAAIRAAKAAGIDVLVFGLADMSRSPHLIGARVIETETGDMIVHKEAETDASDPEGVGKIVDNLAIMIYNELPVVEGFVVNVEPGAISIDLGRDTGTRKGTRCIVFREGKPIVHPVSGAILGKRVQKLGELIVTDVQDKMATARFLDREAPVQVGDKVVVK